MLNVIQTIKDIKINKEMQCICSSGVFFLDAKHYEHESCVA